jgi:hypothetical protein
MKRGNLAFSKEVARLARREEEMLLKYIISR